MDAHTEPAQPATEPTLEEQCRYLVGKLKSSNAARRLRAARALCEAPAVAVPLLVAALDETTDEHREAILATLALLGRRGRAAIPAVEKLCEDERLGKAARAALESLRRGVRIDRETLLNAAFYFMMAVMLALGVAKEAIEWAEVWANLHGPGRAIAFAWGGIGGIAGYFAGANVPVGKVAWKAAKVVAVVGIYFGALVGRLVGELLAPLVAALGG
jgi:hypothetical protein